MNEEGRVLIEEEEIAATHLLDMTNQLLYALLDYDRDADDWHDEDDFEEEDENDPFADRNAVNTPKVEKREPVWKTIWFPESVTHLMAGEVFEFMMNRARG